jgi:predicted nucleic acid-binding protein
MDQVVDANLSIALVLNTPYSDQAQALWERWAAAEAGIFAPDLWAYEVTSALRKAMVVTDMPLAQAQARLETLTQLGVRLVPPTPTLDRLALRWAHRLEHTVAYDAHYLALSETLGCDFWTADRRLVDGAREHAGAGWIHWIGEVG